MKLTNCVACTAILTTVAAFTCLSIFGGQTLCAKTISLDGEPPFRWADVRAWTCDATIWREEAK